MKTLKKILFPVDFSDRCAGAARYVEAYARKFDAEVVLLYVVDFTDYIFGVSEVSGFGTRDIHAERVAKAKSELANFAPAGANLDFPGVTRVVIDGDPGRKIVQYAEEHGVDLIMMPSHGFGPFRRYIIGSVTAKVLHDAHCAVWTGAHMETAPPEAVIGFEKIVCAIDLSEQSGFTLRWASLLAKECGAELSLVHAVPVMEVRPEKYLDEDFHRELRAQAAEAIAGIQARIGTNLSLSIRDGEPAQVLREEAEEKEADLVIIGRGSAAEGFGRLRTHAYAMIRNSPCPVISV